MGKSLPMYRQYCNAIYMAFINGAEIPMKVSKIQSRYGHRDQLLKWNRTIPCGGKPALLPVYSIR